MERIVTLPSIAMVCPASLSAHLPRFIFMQADGEDRERTPELFFFYNITEF